MNKTETAPSRLLSYARLTRIPNVFTAFADIGMGLAFVDFPLRERPWGGALLFAASGLLYTAGMVLNDVFDLDIDAVERPKRPLPSGQIDAAWARRLGLTLLGLGVACGFAAGILAAPPGALPGRSGIVASLVALCVVAYDLYLKRTWLGPVGMGLCRVGNVLLGMSLASHSTALLPSLTYEPSQWLAAGGIGVYIVGVTWFARTEATDSQRGPLIASQAVMAAGILLIGILPEHAGEYGQVMFKPAVFWPVLLAALFVPIVRRGANAILHPRPERVQAVVKNCIQSLILFDAAIAMGTHGSNWGIAVLALLAPMVILGRWVYST